MPAKAILTEEENMVCCKSNVGFLRASIAAVACMFFVNAAVAGGSTATGDTSAAKSFIISQAQSIKEDNTVLKRGKENKEAKVCHGTLKTVKDAQGEGIACNEKDAEQEAFDNLAANHCTGATDPECPADSCEKQACIKTSSKHSAVKKTKFDNVKLEKCDGGKGVKATVSGKEFNCFCRCK
jgi:hypothetical protein